MLFLYFGQYLHILDSICIFWTVFAYFNGCNRARANTVSIQKICDHYNLHIPSLLSKLPGS